MSTQHPDALARQHFMDSMVRAMAASPDQEGFGWHLVALQCDEAPHLGTMTFENWRPLRGMDDAGTTLFGRSSVVVNILVTDTP